MKRVLEKMIATLISNRVKHNDIQTYNIWILLRFLILPVDWSLGVQEVVAEWGSSSVMSQRSESGCRLEECSSLGDGVWTGWPIPISRPSYRCPFPPDAMQTPTGSRTVTSFALALSHWPGTKNSRVIGVTYAVHLQRTCLLPSQAEKCIPFTRKSFNTRMGMKREQDWMNQYKNRVGILPCNENAN